MDLVVIFIGALAGGLTLYFVQRASNRSRSWKKRLDREPVTPLHEARPGDLVKLRGRVRLATAEERLVAPLSQRPCIAYRYRESFMKSGYATEEFFFHTKLKVAPFVFEADGATVPVRTDRLDLRLVIDVIEQNSGPETEAHLDLWAKKGNKVPKKYSVYRREGIVADGAEVLLLARVNRRLAVAGDLPPGFRDAPGERVLEATEEHELFVCADPAWL